VISVAEPVFTNAVRLAAGGGHRYRPSGLVVFGQPAKRGQVTLEC
jgi:hypothetical protein